MPKGVYKFRRAYIFAQPLLSRLQENPLLPNQLIEVNLGVK
jgi:hypothetical protein